MDKRYRDLIDTVPKYYSSEAPELRNIIKHDKLFDFKWCDWLKQEINLWTYWQGAGAETTEINEKAIQEYIFDHPEVLNLGDLQPIKMEKIQPLGGRLDMLFSDEEDNVFRSCIR